MLELLLDELAVDEKDALALLFGLGVGGDDAPRPFDFRLARREGGVGGGDGFRVDQRLAVEAKFSALAADLREAFVIGEIEIDAIKNNQAVGPLRPEAAGYGGPPGPGPRPKSRP